MFHRAFNTKISFRFRCAFSRSQKQKTPVATQPTDSRLAEDEITEPFSSVRHTRQQTTRLVAQMHATGDCTVLVL